MIYAPSDLSREKKTYSAQKANKTYSKSFFNVRVSVRLAFVFEIQSSKGTQLLNEVIFLSHLYFSVLYLKLNLK